MRCFALYALLCPNDCEYVIYPLTRSLTPKNYVCMDFKIFGFFVDFTMDLTN